VPSAVVIAAPVTTTLVNPLPVANSAIAFIASPFLTRYEPSQHDQDETRVNLAGTAY
jgi:hypothetical protein